MRKIDRLFEIIQLLRGKRLRTAEFMANELGVSVRTIYRDIQGLMASGVPIEGERGVGYVIHHPIEMPPLHFTPLELKALTLGANMVAASTDDEMAKAAAEAVIKIQETLPSSATAQKSASAYIYFKNDPRTRQILIDMRRALDQRHKILLAYKDEYLQQTDRIIRPLGLEYWGKIWTLTAWCELRNSFRTFRVDRIISYQIQDKIFNKEPGKTYDDYLKQIEHSK